MKSDNNVTYVYTLCTKWAVPVSFIFAIETESFDAKSYSTFSCLVSFSIPKPVNPEDAKTGNFNLLLNS